MQNLRTLATLNLNNLKFKSWVCGNFKFNYPSFGVKLPLC